MGEAVQLFCRSEGSPSPQVEWFDNNREKILPTSSELSDYEVLNYDRLMRFYTPNKVRHGEHEYFGLPPPSNGTALLIIVIADK